MRPGLEIGRPVGVLTGCAGQEGQVQSSEAGGRAPAPRGAASRR